jgi:polyisoprenoid-binding protein YceI
VSKTLRAVLIAVVVVVVVGGFGVWWFVIRDTSGPAASVAAVNAGAAGTAPSRDTPDGQWKVQQDPTVFAGYRVAELFGGETVKRTAVGRSPAVTGTMTVTGSTIPQADITVDVTKLTSDQSRRDSAIASRGLETDTFPQATFKLTQPIALPGVPEKGKTINVTAHGDLTLHGVTKTVDIPLAATWNGNSISVATTGDGFPIAFSDYGMQAIDISIVKTDDHGTLELQLLLVPA